MFRRIAGSPGLERLFGRLIRIGRAPEMAPSEARYVVLSNIIAMLGVAFTLGFAPILVFSGSPVFPALQVVYALGYLPVLWLNHRHHHTAAATYLVLSSHLLAISQVLVEGTELDVHLFFMLHTMLPFLVFAPRHDKLMFTLSALAGIDLVLVVALGHHLPHLGPVIAPERLRIIRPILLGGLFATLAACAHYARRATLIAETALDRAHQRSEDLLLNILPPSIARRLKLSGGTIADGFSEVSVLFADIVGFTRMSAQRPPEHIVGLLNDLFCKFDDVAGRLGLEKIKTIGDCYMVAAGVPRSCPDHASVIVNLALDMRAAVTQRKFGDRELAFRIGINSGPVVAGVIGRKKFIYDLWGDAVNIASRMESQGQRQCIQITENTFRLIVDEFICEPRGKIKIKGADELEVWHVLGRKAS